MSTAVLRRDLSRTGAELLNGVPAEFVVLDPAIAHEAVLQQPARVGRVVGDSKRDQLAIERLVGRVCRK